MVVLAVVALGLVGWLGWRLLTESGESSSAGSADVTAPGAGELVFLAPGSGLELRLLGWYHAPRTSEGGGLDAGGSSQADGSGEAGQLGSATALATLQNIDSRYSEFVLDVAAVDHRSSHILGYGTAQLVDLPPGATGTFTLTIPDSVPDTALLGVANLWGRTPGDPQIHPINFAAKAGADGGFAIGSARQTDPSSDATSEPQLVPWSEPQLMEAASQFATSVATMQSDCRSETSLVGLVCLSRRNFPDFLLAQPARDLLSGQPYFHQQADPTGPPRAFELTAPGGATACVGQRIDKQTSGQVAILGSCIQRGLFAGDGAVQSATPASPKLPSAPVNVSRTSIPVGTGGLPGAPVEGDGRAGSAGSGATGKAGIGDTVALGPLDFTVDGVQVGLTEVPGLPLPAGTYTLVTITLTNRGAEEVDLNSLELTIVEARGGPLPIATGGQSGSVGWPPQPGVIAPGESVTTTVITEVTVDQTAATATLSDRVTGARQAVSLLPPPT